MSLRDHFPNSTLAQEFLYNYRNTTITYRIDVWIQRYSTTLLTYIVNTEKPCLIGLTVMDIRRFYVTMANQNQVQFVTIRLQKSDKKAFDAWASDKVDDVEELQTQLVIAGYKMSVSHDFEHDTFICAVTGKKNASSNVNKCFTSRADTMVESIMLCLYKHFALANGREWDTITTSQDNWG